VAPRDQLDRPLRELRISVTDRCNFRCTYCMPQDIFGPDYRFLERKEILTYEELTRLARLFVAAGVGKVRITGGEPLVRRDVERLVRALAEIPGLADLTMTTNGALLAERAAGLAAAGLQRVTVSLDSLDKGVFRKMNSVGAPVAAVLRGIEAAAAAGLQPVKVNAVVRRGLNDQTVIDLARRFHGTGHILRFIEYMDVGNSNGWRLDDVVPGAEILARIHAEMPLEPMEPRHRGEVARRWRYRDGGGEIGLVTSVSRPFCGDCSRARLSPEGHLYTCLFAASGFDLRPLLRGGADDDEIGAAIRSIWRQRDDRYSEKRSAATAGLPRVEMSHIGG
jgi:cyclic pyranopterin phosphate synthase